MLVIIESEPDTEISKSLIDGLSETLQSITGSDGRNSFQDWEPNPRALFVVALHDEEPVGCGALRPIDQDIAEVKRMYAKYRVKGSAQKYLNTWRSLPRQLTIRKYGLKQELAILTPANSI